MVRRANRNRKADRVFKRKVPGSVSQFFSLFKFSFIASVHCKHSTGLATSACITVFCVTYDWNPESQSRHNCRLQPPYASVPGELEESPPARTCCGAEELTLMGIGPNRSLCRSDLVQRIKRLEAECRLNLK